MAFEITKIQKGTVSDSHGNAPQNFTYNNSGVDDLATIKASGYFNNYAFALSLDDTIYVVGSDGADWVKVTAVTPNVTVTSILATLPAASVTLNELSLGIRPTHVVKSAGKHTTVGGSASEAISIVGSLTSDIAFVNMDTQGGAPVTILSAKVTAPGTLTVVFSADPAADHTVAYQLLRAAV